MLDAGANPDAAATDGPRALTEAARLGRDTILAELLRGGADPSATDTAGLRAIDHAMVAGHLTTVDRLILDAAVRAGGGPQVMTWFAAVPVRTATAPPWQDVLSGELLSLGLMYAALHERVDLIGAMRRAREVTNGTGYHALLLAARFGREQATWSLLGVDTHPDLASANPWQSTALMEAARDGHVTIGRRLLAAGARPDRTDVNGETALHRAARAGTEAYARLLLEAGARRDIRSRAGLVPADVARDAGHLELAAALSPDAKLP